MKKLHRKNFLRSIVLVEFVNNHEIPQSDIQCIIHEDDCIVLYYWE